MLTCARHVQCGLHPLLVAGTANVTTFGIGVEAELFGDPSPIRS